jgi:hypothetical protein
MFALVFVGLSPGIAAGGPPKPPPPKIKPKFNAAAKPNPAAGGSRAKAPQTGKRGLHERANIASSSLNSKVKGLKVPKDASAKLNAASNAAGKQIAPKRQHDAKAAQKRLQQRDQPTPKLAPRSSRGFREYQARDIHRRHQESYQSKPPTLPKKRTISERMRQPENLPKGALPNNAKGHLKKAFDKVAKTDNGSS